MHVAILLLLNLNTNKDNFVYRTCFTNKQEEADIFATETKNPSEAEFCIWKETSCDKAEVVVYLEKKSKKRFYVSTRKDFCK